MNKLSSAKGLHDRGFSSMGPEMTPPMSERIATIYEGRSRSLARFYSFREEGEQTEIVTPFLDPRNERISLFVSLEGEKLTLHDGGLASQIVNRAGRPDGHDILSETLKDYELHLIGDELCVGTSESELPGVQFRMCNAIIDLMGRLRGVSQI